MVQLHLTLVGTYTCKEAEKVNCTSNLPTNLEKGQKILDETH